MRIGIISTLARPVPPSGEGSVELIVSHLTEYLVQRGHDVTLFALPGSKTTARLISPVKASYVGDPDKWDWQLYEAFHVREAFAMWREFDIINCHSYWFGLMHADAVPIPSIHSHHIEPGPDYRFLAERTRNRHLHFCSKFQARDFHEIPGVHVIPHGIDVETFAPGSSQNHTASYLAWIGRFHPDKGVLDAIELARSSGIALKLAAPPNDYYQQEIARHVDGNSIEYVGELTSAAKAKFLANARALVYPVQRGEPFGLVLIEAMAAGVPVLAYDRGAVSEIIEPGVTGYLGNTLADLIDNLPCVGKLDRTRIRDEASRRFSREVMGGRMEKLMLQVTPK